MVEPASLKHFFQIYNHGIFIVIQFSAGCLGMFKCANSRCVSHTDVCDEVDDCRDLSDELACGFGRFYHIT